MHVKETRFSPRGTPGIVLYGHVWSASGDSSGGPVCIFAHPWGVLGGSSANTAPFARKLAESCGITCVTFNLRGVGKSGGRSTYTCRDEVNDLLGGCDYALQSLNCEKIILIGSSAGAAIAGSAIDMVKEVVGYVAIGYTFGWLASWVFGSHFQAVQLSVKPKLFIMGSNDIFTSPNQLQGRVGLMKNATRELIDGCGHFDLEDSSRVEEVCEIISKFIREKVQGA